MKFITAGTLSEALTTGALDRPAQQTDSKLIATVRDIITDVRESGDAALARYTEQLDGVPNAGRLLTDAEITACAARVQPDVARAIDRARTTIETFAAASAAKEYTVETATGVTCSYHVRPINPVGLYVPAGSAPLPSSALMQAVPARLAGCSDIIMATPPARTGTIIDPAVAYVARELGTRVLAAGGAQAIAALAYGTGTVPRCRKIFGPGNSYVATAKSIVSSEASGPAIDFLAGPSELMVICDDTCVPAFVAADLLSQAEHGPDSQVVAVCIGAGLAEQIATHVQRQMSDLPRAEIALDALANSCLITVPDEATALEVCNAYAPEHLIVATADAELTMDGVQSAGSVFLGNYTPESLGDYCSGTNHVLPTAGAAHATGGLRVADFQKAITVQRASRQGLQELAGTTVTLARAEGLEGHARAVTRRLGGPIRDDLDTGRYESAADARGASATQDTPQIRLDANESATASVIDPHGAMRVYPDPAPADVRGRLAGLYGVGTERVRVTSGSGEAIATLVAAAAPPGAGTIITTSPTFGLYARAARNHGCSVVDVPQTLEGNRFAIDADAVIEAAREHGAQLVFLCAPANPTGQAIDAASIRRISEALLGETHVVVDNAYAFPTVDPDAVRPLELADNVVALSTFSKSIALAGARLGYVVAAPATIAALGETSGIYPLAAPVIEAGRAALDDASLAAARAERTAMAARRDRFTVALREAPGIQRVFDSDANFVLAECTSGSQTAASLAGQGILVRSWNTPLLRDIVRITIGTDREMSAVLTALGAPAGVVLPRAS